MSVKFEIMYFGRTSEMLQITSEVLSVADENFSLGKLLDQLRDRGNSWAYELDEHVVLCTINNNSAAQSCAIKDGDEIDISSRKSLFEI